jgi:hypothetical protein
MTSIGFPKQFDKNVSSIISLFLSPKPQKFLDWVKTEKLERKALLLVLNEQMLMKYLTRFNKIANKIANKRNEFCCCHNNDIPICMNGNVQISYSQRQIFMTLEDWYMILRNPHTIGIIQDNIDLVDWKVICYNENAIPLIQNFINTAPENIDKLNWSVLCSNPNAIPIIEQFINDSRINWSTLSSNKHAIPLISQPEHYCKINWNALSKNENAIHLLEQNKDKIDWLNICDNPNAFHLLKEFTNNFETNLPQLDWEKLSINKIAPQIIQSCPFMLNFVKWKFLSGNPYAMDIIEQNLEHVNWTSLCCNPNAIKLLEKHKNKFEPTIGARLQNGYHIYTYSLHHEGPEWKMLTTNPAIIETDHSLYNLFKSAHTKMIYNL